MRSKIHKLLRSSEKYLKTDLVYLAKSGFWLFGNYGVISTLSLILSIFFARLLPQETYGVYRYILSISAIIGALSLTGMNTAVTHAVARGFSKTLTTSFWIQIKWSILPFTISVVTSLYYLSNGNKTIALAILITGLLIPISNSANTYSAFLNGKKDFSRIFLSGTVSNIIYTIAMIAALLSTQNIVYLILVYAISTTATNVYYYWKTSKTITAEATSDPSAIDYGKNLTYMGMIGTIANQIDNILIFHYLGGAQLAVYSFATLIPEKIRGLFKFFSVITLPNFSKKGTDDAAILHKTKLLVFGALGIMVLYILSAPMVYKVLFPYYHNSVLYSQVYSFTFLTTAATTILLTSLLAKKAQKMLYIYNTASPVIQIVLLVVLIYFYGIWGAVVARVVSHTINVFLLIPFRQQK